MTVGPFPDLTRSDLSATFGMSGVVLMFIVLVHCSFVMGVAGWGPVRRLRNWENVGRLRRFPPLVNGSLLLGPHRKPGQEMYPPTPKSTSPALYYVATIEAAKCSPNYRLPPNAASNIIFPNGLLPFFGPFTFFT